MNFTDEKDYIMRMIKETIRVLFAVAESAIVAESKSVICQMYILQKRFGISTHSSNVESVLLQLYRLTCVCLKFL